MNRGRLFSWHVARPEAKAVVVLTIVLATTGCSSSKRDAGRIVVSGTVSYDGKPLEKGTVLFAALGGRDAASAPIGTKGAFRVSLLLGEYEAAVRCFADDETTESPNDLSPPKSLIPEKYTDAKTSGLKVTASAGMAPIRLDLSR